MPTSRSPSRGGSTPNRGAKTPPPRPARRLARLWPFVLIGLAATLAVIVSALPASFVKHVLPQGVHAEDFSGSFWHGSAGKISIDARDAGALEWRLHPAALLGMAVAANLHWVKGGFVVDAGITVDRRGFTARGIKGGGPIDDLRDIGVAPGSQGIAAIDFSEVKGDYAKLTGAAGDIRLSNFKSVQIADGADLGSYDLRLDPGGITPEGEATAHVVDTGGPLELDAVIHYSANRRTGMLTGALRERPDAPAALRAQLENLSQLRARDPQGRIPIELEFAL